MKNHTKSLLSKDIRVDGSDRIFNPIFSYYFIRNYVISTVGNFFPTAPKSFFITLMFSIMNPIRVSYQTYNLYGIKYSIKSFFPAALYSLLGFSSGLLIISFKNLIKKSKW